MNSDTLDLGSHHLAYHVAGREDAPVVFLGHCFGADHHFWDAQLPILADYRTVRIDTRGHGASTTPPGPYTLDQLGDDVLALCDALGIKRMHYIGASMGGMVGQNIALRYSSRILSLGLITTTCAYTEAGRAVWRRWVETVRVKGREVLTEELLARWFTAQAVHSGADCVAYMRASYQAMSSDAFTHIAEAIITDLDYGDQLARIAVPALVVASPTDPGVPRETSEHMAAQIPRAELGWLSPAMHLATLEHPSRFNAILSRFLSRHA